MLDKLRWQFFPPAERAAIENEIRAFIRRRCHQSADLMELAALAAVADADETIRTARARGVSPEQLALRVIARVSAAFVASGRYHTGPGVLSEFGRDLLRTSTAAIEALRAKGYATALEAQEDLARMQKQIGATGVVGPKESASTG
jgi:hypothetical protein